VQLSGGDVPAANLRTYTLDKKTDVAKEVFSSTFKSKSAVAHEQFVPSSQYTQTFFAGVAYDITPEEKPVPSEEKPVEPPKSSGGGGSKSGKNDATATLHMKDGSVHRVSAATQQQAVDKAADLADEGRVAGVIGVSGNTRRDSSNCFGNC